jgi:hypothetical protein
VWVLLVLAVPCELGSACVRLRGRHETAALVAGTTPHVVQVCAAVLRADPFALAAWLARALECGSLSG